MKQLTGLDASFLYLETPSQFGHVSGLSIFEPPDDPAYDPLAAWRLQIARRLHLLEPLRRRLRMVPFGLDHPYWVEDASFDLDFHVRETAVPPPGDDHQLADLVARLVGRPLDRSRPLWETYVIQGLAGGRFAVLTKIHHATVDGASGAELLTMMLDTTVEGDEVEGPGDDHEPGTDVEPGADVEGTDGEGVDLEDGADGEPDGEWSAGVATVSWRTERVPGDGEMVLMAAGSLIRKPGRAVLLSARTARELGQATRNPVLVAAANQVRGSLRGPLGTVLNLGRTRDEVGEAVGPLPSLAAPRTPFNAPITPHRRFAFRSTTLGLVKAVKNELGATVNDVVMAVCAGGLRTWLESHDALPDGPVVAMVPVSIRTGEEAERWTNRVSAIFASLPTDVAEPVERVQRVHDAMVDAKQLFDAVPAETLTDFAQFPPPAVFTQAMRMATRLSSRFRSPVNLVISNVPGPREPLYAAGSRLLHYYPVSTIVDGQGLNITVQSYLDTLDFGLVSCRELVPDLWDMLDAIVDDLHALAGAVGVDHP
ncbi:MAG: WS/DGAT/MGAT family O-acyltransferase [Acidimicrobiales bacterium]